MGRGRGTGIKLNVALEKEKEEGKTEQGENTRKFLNKLLLDMHNQTTPCKVRMGGATRPISNQLLLLKCYQNIISVFHPLSQKAQGCLFREFSSRFVCSVKYLPVPAPLPVLSCPQGQAYCQPHPMVNKWVCEHQWPNSEIWQCQWETTHKTQVSLLRSPHNLLLKYDWHIISSTYLKCTICWVLTDACTPEITITIKIGPHDFNKHVWMFLGDVSFWVKFLSHQMKSTS